MKETGYSNLNVTQFKSQEKNTSTAVIMLIACIVIMIYAAIAGFYSKSPKVFVFLPVVFLPILSINIKKLKQLRQEIKSRDNNSI